MLPFALPLAPIWAALKLRSASPMAFAIITTLMVCACGLVGFKTWLHFHDRTMRRVEAAEMVAKALEVENTAKRLALQQRENHIVQQSSRIASDAQKIEEIEREKEQIRAKADLATGVSSGAIVFPDRWLRQGRDQNRTPPR